jgi:hypothetical protein
MPSNHEEQAIRERVKGGKTPPEYMFSALPQIADIARSEYHNSANQPHCLSRVLGPSNSMLGGGATTPQDYPQ